MPHVLSQFRCFVFTATSGAQARGVLADVRPHLVVLEIMLPDEDGLLLCSDLNQSGTSVLVCTATRRKRDRVLALRLGARDFIQKPFDVYELGARLDRALGRRPGRLSTSEMPGG